jgi:hypothetical protein
MTKIRNKVKNKELSVLEGMYRACSLEGGPICLESALASMFGSSGAALVKELAIKAMGKRTVAGTPPEVWELFDSYVGAWDNILGNNTTQVLEAQISKHIENLGCTGCPTYTKCNLSINKL